MSLSRGISIFLLFILLTQNSCVLVAAIAWREKTIDKKVWKQDEYKIKLITRRGGFGPQVHICEIYRQDLILYKQIVKHYYNASDIDLIFFVENYHIKIDLINYKMIVY